MNLKEYSSGCSFRTCSDKSVLVVWLVCISFAFSCASALYIPSVSHETPDAGLSELKAGRESYIRKCGSCHTLYLPERYNKQEWKGWMEKMVVKVAVDSLEKDQILKYLYKGR